jgi:hypothetical protein
VWTAGSHERKTVKSEEATNEAKDRHDRSAEQSASHEKDKDCGQYKLFEETPVYSVIIGIFV